MPDVVYELDEYFAGRKVNVTGTREKTTATIHVKRIDTAPGSAGLGLVTPVTRTRDNCH